MATYFVAPILILVVVIVLAVLAFRALRKSRADVERYRAASSEERAALDEKMNRDLRLTFTMRPLSGWSLVGGGVIFFLLMALGAWLRT